jgi:3',5'-cyclic AMP phosphodiesterase CpdA
MMTFIHLSDLHIHGDMKKEDNVNCRAIVRRIIRSYPGRSKPAILLTGDIVDDGKEDQYINAVKLLRPLVKKGFRLLPCPGNHDYGKFGLFYNHKSRQYFQVYILGRLLGMAKARNTQQTRLWDLYPMVTVLGDTAFIGLDSVVGNRDELVTFASGEVGESQRKQLNQALHKHRKKQRVVYLHHHPFMREFTMELDDAKQVMQILSGQTTFLSFGHKHASQIWFDRDHVDCVLASGKTTERSKNCKFQFREVVLDGDTNHVSMVSFKA